MQDSTHEHPNANLGRVFQRNVTFDIGIEDLAAEADGEAADGRFDLLELAGEISRRGGDGCHAKGCAVPGEGVVELGDGDVEAVAKLVLEGADGLTAVFERVRVLDGELDGEGRDGHEVRVRHGTVKSEG